MIAALFLPSMKPEVVFTVLNQMARTGVSLSTAREANIISQWFESLGDWQVSRVIVSRLGRYTQWGESLEKVTFSSDEMEALRNALMDTILLPDVMYMNTSPEEVQEFQTFLMNHEPFDVVVDGLNIINWNAKRPRFSKFKIDLEMLANQWDHILIVTRKNTRRYVREANISRRVTFFWTDYSSHDDIFALMATMFSGHDAYFLSNDKMRNFVAKLGPKEPKMMSRWLRHRQIRYDFNTGQIQYPSQVKFSVQHSNNSWHIPYKEKDEDA